MVRSFSEVVTVWNFDSNDDGRTACDIASKLNKNTNLSGKVGGKVNDHKANYIGAAPDYKLGHNQKLRYLPNIFSSTANYSFRNCV